MHQTLSDVDHEEAAGDNPLVDGHEMSAVRASPNCEDGVEGYGEAVVVTCMWRWCQGLGERDSVQEVRLCR